MLQFHNFWYFKKYSKNDQIQVREEIFAKN